MKKSIFAAVLLVALAACSNVPMGGGDQLVASPCALPTPQAGVQCDGYRVNP